MNRIILALLCALCACSPAMASEALTITRIVDGDSARLSNGLELRLLDVDAPEIRGRCPAEIDLAQRAKRFFADAIRDHSYRVEIDDRKHDKYGRTLAHVIIEGKDLSQMIIAAGLGRPYSGGKRQPWC